ncbi:MAG: hypothetical protein GY810_29515 [Aureispira sp.]|nr:hypothetical protein [Aureispira sp.]
MRVIRIALIGLLTGLIVMSCEAQKRTKKDAVKTTVGSSFEHKVGRNDYFMA